MRNNIKIKKNPLPDEYLQDVMKSKVTQYQLQIRYYYVSSRPSILLIVVLIKNLILLFLYYIILFLFIS